MKRLAYIALLLLGLSSCSKTVVVEIREVQYDLFTPSQASSLELNGRLDFELLPVVSDILTIKSAVRDTAFIDTMIGPELLAVRLNELHDFSSRPSMEHGGNRLDRIVIDRGVLLQGYWVSDENSVLHVLEKSRAEFVLSSVYFEVNHSSSEDSKISGSIDFNTVIMSGSGTLDMSELYCEVSKIIVHGSGDCYLHASQTLTIIIEGSGNVYYTGGAVPLVIKNGSGNAIPL